MVDAFIVKDPKALLNATVPGDVEEEDDPGRDDPIPCTHATGCPLRSFGTI